MYRANSAREYRQSPTCVVCVLGPSTDTWTLITYHVNADRAGSASTADQVRHVTWSADSLAGFSAERMCSCGQCWGRAGVGRDAPGRLPSASGENRRRLIFSDSRCITRCINQWISLWITLWIEQWDQIGRTRGLQWQPGISDSSTGRKPVPFHVKHPKARCWIQNFIENSELSRNLTDSLANQPSSKRATSSLHREHIS